MVHCLDLPNVSKFFKLRSNQLTSGSFLKKKDSPILSERKPLNTFNYIQQTFVGFFKQDFLVGGFNPVEKY